MPTVPGEPFLKRFRQEKRQIFIARAAKGLLAHIRNVGPARIKVDMKMNNLGRILFLVLAVVTAIWLNYEEGTTSAPSRQSSVSGVSQDYLLAVSWQPAFCEQRPNKAECRSQRAGRFDTSHFSLHGLWPQPRNETYCNVSRETIATDKSGRWSRLPKLDLSAGLRNELERKMPGYRSYLHRHEWFKHGTCMPGFSPERYFRVSLDLLDQLNASAVRELAAGNVNTDLGFRDFSYAFGRAFGNDGTIITPPNLCGRPGYRWFVLG